LFKISQGEILPISVSHKGLALRRNEAGVINLQPGIFFRVCQQRKRRYFEPSYNIEILVLARRVFLFGRFSEDFLLRGYI